MMPVLKRVAVFVSPEWAARSWVASLSGGDDGLSSPSRLIGYYLHICRQPSQISFTIGPAHGCPTFWMAAALLGLAGPTFAAVVIFTYCEILRSVSLALSLELQQTGKGLPRQKVKIPRLPVVGVERSSL